MILKPLPRPTPPSGTPEDSTASDDWTVSSTKVDGWSKGRKGRVKARRKDMSAPIKFASEFRLYRGEHTQNMESLMEWFHIRSTEHDHARSPAISPQLADSGDRSLICHRVSIHIWNKRRLSASGNSHDGTWADDRSIGYRYRSRIITMVTLSIPCSQLCNS